MKNVAGGLDEINHILSITQKKIDRFKVSKLNVSIEEIEWKNLAKIIC